MSQYYLAVDIGASSGRHILGSVENGKIVLVQKMNKNVGFQKQKLEAEGYSRFIDIRYPDEMAKLEEL